ncbi:MAG TPA: arsenic resistance N-acetyltransferase ArsN2 [Cyclobacteriaceae bacterium]|nr:arsenic resistance N-acetyltransferase ArsN2 [Cyclobacteriaceae bacterium]
MEMEIRGTVIEDAASFDEFCQLLKSAGLPHQDLDFKKNILIGYYDDERLIGTGALETYGPYALLRSLAVMDAMRGRSLGSRITDDLIAEARKKKIKSIYLLTESARLFFKRKGFKDIPRNEAPTEVKSSTEFSEVCHDGAVCMELIL